jgi:YfiH family protein
MRPDSDLLFSPAFSRFRWLVHAFTTRQLGREKNCNLGYSVTRDKAGVTANRRRLLRRLSAGSFQLVGLRQRHTDIVVPVEEGGKRTRPEIDGAWRLPGDALVTSQSGQLLAVQVADCVPVLLVDTKQRVVAAVHAGWRGTVKRIVEKTVGILQQRFGTDRANLRAALGPCIHSCCYEVGREVVEQVEAQFAFAGKIIAKTEPSPHEVHWQQSMHALLRQDREVRPRPALTAPEATKYHLDLVVANRLQLEAAGVPAKSIWASPLCTACNTDKLFSYRAEHGKTGRMMGVVGIRP